MPVVNYLWDTVEDNIVEEFDDAGTSIAEYTTEPAVFGNVISQHREGQSSFFHYDAQGSTLAVTDNNQQITDTIAYSAFGQGTEQSGATDFPFQHIGQAGYYRDSLMGSCIVRHRHYDPTYSRWLTADPFGSSTSIYGYVANAPLIAIDPSGLWAIYDAAKFHYISDDVADTFQSLVKLVAPQLDEKKNSVCVIPVDFVRESDWSNQRVTPCGVYSVANIVDGLPVGAAVRASVGRDLNGYISAASDFFGLLAGQRHLSGPATAGLIRKAAGSGATPIDSLTVIGHSWGHQKWIGGTRGIDTLTDQRFGLDDLVTEARKVGVLGLWGPQKDLEKAKAANLAPICWFRRYAEVWFVGCITRGIANQFADQLLRFEAHATGSNQPTWAFGATLTARARMGFGTRPRGGPIRPDDTFPPASTEQDYLIRGLLIGSPTRGWTAIQGKN
jgi:RHS repeat-associated protein